MQRIHSNICQDSLRAKNNYRNRIELLCSRVKLLRGKDKLLMTMYLENGNSFWQMAGLLGVNEGTVARRIRKVTKRLLDGEYITCLQHRDKLSKAELNIACDHFLQGISIKKIAVRQKTTYYRIYETVKRIRGIIETADKHKAEESRRSVCQIA